MALGLKDPLLPHPLHSTVEKVGEEGGGFFLSSHADLLHKNMNYSQFIIKSTF
jgi:hypothetical protein